MVEVVVTRTADLAADQLSGIRALLSDAFAGELSDDDWAHALGAWHVTASDDGRLVAHAAVVTRTLEVGGRARRAGYVEGVATAPLRQGQGLGSTVMRRVADLVRAKFELGALSTDRHPFYERLGW